MGRIKEYIFPSSIAEAVKLACEEDVIIVSGGTGVMARRNNLDGKTLVDITRLDLSKIEKDNEYIHIGPTASTTEIEMNSELKIFANGLVSRAAENVGSRQIRNQVTAGGNIVSSYPWSDLPPALMCLDAQAVFSGENGDKKISLEEFFSYNNTEKKALGLLSDVVISNELSEYSSRFYAFQKTVVDYSMATVATAAKVENEKITDIRIAVSGCTARPVRIKKLEEHICGLESYNKEEIYKLCKQHCVNICNRKDFRLSSEYAEHIVAVHTARMILEYVGKEA